MQSLLDQGIATRRGIMCSHREPAYANERQRHDLRQSEFAQNHSILLPIYAQMTEDDINRVADALKGDLKKMTVAVRSSSKEMLRRAKPGARGGFAYGQG
jgi:dTDP-4-amino-4,6-dideoxygalactose transaminase